MPWWSRSASSSRCPSASPSPRTEREHQNEKTDPLLLLALGLARGAQAPSGGRAWDKAPEPHQRPAALQNGAKLFVNYCLNCHSAAYMRYNRLQDIGLTEQQIKDNLLFATDKVGDDMKARDRPEGSQGMVRRQPARPDADRALARRPRRHRRRLPVHLPAHLLPRRRPRPTGWNNLVFPNVGMPHVLWELQGEREPQFETRRSTATRPGLQGLEAGEPGTHDAAAVRRGRGRPGGYLQWMASRRRTRVRVGVWVLLFLGVFTVSWRLNAAFWKESSRAAAAPANPRPARTVGRAPTLFGFKGQTS
jgi:ubiquinol-cytochrome c reductase cytochrome c1 subunit